ncbi:fad dependent oxidoreductase [Ophiostoma piceae UAMH 11346]|uniref:Fad dependent oxidoreductase n=1 Tax=Ophiostoma piceae (strain UAMH 11346) TaxID=1262450 RepID=S3CWC0_OPHP1|nr:fad dependent oxidoreductase [Ophiostoma piceae UAMH 11346]
MTAYEEIPEAAKAAPSTATAPAEPATIAGLPSENPSASYWLHDPSSVLLGHRSTPELPAEADVVVIGSGITGSFAADKLVGSGDGGSVLLLEAREACFGATGRNGGHCQPMIYYSAPDVAGFELANFHFLDGFVAKNNIDCDWHRQPQGGVHAFLDQDLFDAAVAVVDALAKKQPGLAKQVAVVRAGAPAVTAGPNDTPVTLKDLRLRDGVVGALVQKHAASVWPYKLVAWVLERLVKTQPSSKFNLQTNTPATKLTKDDGQGWLVETPRGTVKAKAVLLATNGYTSHLLPPSLADLIVPVRAQVAALVPPTTASGGPAAILASSYVFMGHDYEFSDGRGERDEYLVQRPFVDAASSKVGPGGHLILGGGRERAANSGVGVWRDDEVEPVVAEFLRTHLAPALDVGDEGEPPAPLKADYEWTGVMGFSRDHHPWVGQVPSEILGEPADDASSLYIAAGFSGHGMPSTSLCGRAVAKLIRKDLKWTSAEGAEAEEADHPLPDCHWLTTERLEKVRATCAPVAETDKRGFIVDFQGMLEARLAGQ